MKQQILSALLAAALCAGTAPAALAAQAGSAVTASDSITANRRADLDTLMQTLESKHPNLYSKHSKSEFDAKRTEIEKGLDTMSDFDFAIAVSELTALIGDSHTLASIGSVLSSTAHFLPLNLSPMAEGLTITGLPAAYKDCLGGVLTAVNGVSMDELEQRISPMLSADNDARRHRQFYGTFYVYEILEHYGIAEQPKDIRLTVQTASGAKEITVDALDSAALQSMDAVYLERETTPVTAADSSKLYFMKPLDDRTLYIQYNSCREDPALPMDTFAEQVRTALEQNGYTRVIVDLRNNGGGSDGVIMPLYYLLSEKHDQDGLALYTLIGDKTFSSALINAVEFKQAGAVLVGTPTGGSVDHFGEVSSFTLPHSGIAVQYSNSFFDLGSLLDAAKPYDTESLPPDIEAPQTLSDYLSGKDTAVETVLARTGDAVQPKTVLTRGALAAALGRAYIAETGSALSVQQFPFADVTPFHYASPYIAWAQANNLMCGESTVSFVPNRAVTRQELAAVLNRYAAFRGKSVQGQATPSDRAAIAPWAADAACTMAGAGVLPLQNGAFSPRSTVLRADLDGILARFSEAEQ